MPSRSSQQHFWLVISVVCLATAVFMMMMLSALSLSASGYPDLDVLDVIAEPAVLFSIAEPLIAGLIGLFVYAFS